MASLLKQAIRINSAESLRKTQNGDSRLHGISADDQADIQREIDEVQRRQRLGVSPELLEVREGRRGILFPVIVNLLAVTLIVAGVFVLPALFTDEAVDEELPSEALASAEGEVLRELREEAERQLQEREAQIAEVQERLASLEREREDVDLEIERRVSEREAELQRQLERELAEERERLEAQAISASEVDVQLAEFEAERQAEIDEEISSYVAELESERDSLVAELAALESEFASELDELRAERDRIAAEAEAVEAEAQVDEEAEALLADLRERRERDSRIEQQITGFYEAFREAWTAGELERAGDELSELERFLNDPSIRTRSAVERRRDTDLFIIESLGALVSAEMQAEAAAAEDAVDADEAALSEAALALATEQEIAADTEAASELMSEAEAALEIDDLRGAAERYMELVRDYPRAEQREAALDGLAEVLRQREEEGETLSQELALLEDDFAQLERERDELVATIEGLESDLAAAREEREVAESEAQARAEELEQALARAEQAEREADEAERRVEQEATRAEEAERRVEQEMTRAEEAERRVEELQREAAAVAEAFEGAEDELARLAELRERANRLEELIRSYESVRSAAGSGDMSLRERRVLDDFLTDEPVQHVLPGIAEQIRRLDETAYMAGRDEGISEAIDMLSAVGSIPTAAERVRYLERAVDSGTGSAEVDVIARELIDIIRSTRPNDG